MTKEVGSVSRKIQQIRQNAEALRQTAEAEDFLFRRFFRWLLRDAEKAFARMPSVDPNTPAGSAMRSVLMDLHIGVLEGVSNRGQLINLLRHRYEGKKKDALRRALAGKRPPPSKQDTLDTTSRVVGEQEHIRSIEALSVAVDFLKTLSYEKQLILCYRSIGFGNEEIATMLDVSERTVANRLTEVRSTAAEFIAGRLGGQEAKKEAGDAN